MTAYPNISGHYTAILMENDFPKHPLLLDVMTQVHLPNGNIYNCRIEEDLSKYLIGIKDKGYIAKAIASNVSYELLEKIRADIANNLENAIWEKIRNASI